jgi:predicted hydrolase (HD superfamily)
MGIVKDRFKEKADIISAEIKDLLKEHGNKKIGEVTLSQVYQGMRGMTGLVTETSLLDAHKRESDFVDTVFRNYKNNYPRHLADQNLARGPILFNVDR